jgi:hypothetical protein
MIHPLTLVTFLAFFGAGFYVFQTKEDVAQLDRELRDIRRQTELERGRTQVLAAEWARLNDQDRLRQMAGIHLRNMQPMEPAQFQRLEDAQRRMPVALAFTPVPTGFQPRADAPGAPGEVLVFNAATARRDGAPVALAAAPPAVPPVASPAVASPAVASPAVAIMAPVVAPAAMPANNPAPALVRVAEAAPARLAVARPAVAPPVATPIRLSDATPRPLPAPRPRQEVPSGDAAPRPVAPAPQPAIRTAMVNPSLAGPGAGYAAGSMLGGASSALPPPVPFGR